MLTGIVAGFGEPLGTDRLAALRARGFRLIRQDLQTGQGRHPQTDAVLAEGAAWTAQGGQMLYIVDGTTLGRVPAGAWVEVLNEPEYLSPADYALLLHKVWPTVLTLRLTVWAGSIGNTDADSLLWLQRVLQAAPMVTHVAVHRYSPEANQDRTKAHKGFGSRDGELRWLRDIIGPRPYLVSEVGYHSAWRRTWWFWRTRLSWDEQARRVMQELDYWRAHGAEACCVYQENDAPGATADQWGVRDARGVWKTGTGYGPVW